MSSQAVSSLEQARQAVRTRQIAAAGQHFLEHLRLNPDDAAARKEYREMQRGLPLFSSRREALVQPASSSVKQLHSLFKKRNAADLLNRSEELLRENPFDLPVLFELAKAAREAGHFQAAIYTLNDLYSQGMRQVPVLRELGLAYYQAGRYEDARKVFSRYDWRNDPEDVRKIVESDIPAMITAARFGEAPDVAALEKQKGEALRSQKASEFVRDEETLRSKVASLEAVVANASLEAGKRRTCACEIARLFRQFRKYDQAVAVLEKARDFGGSDVERMLTDLKLERADAEIARLETGARESAEARAALDAAVRSRWSLAVSEFQALVRSAPTSIPELHLRLGEALYRTGTLSQDGGLVKQAIAELQKEYAEQRQKDQAGILLGQCFVRLRLYGLAKKHFGDVLAALRQKEAGREGRETVFRALYELGQVHLVSGEKAQALEVFSEILRRDVTWGDVADLVLRLNAELQAPTGPPADSS